MGINRQSDCIHGALGAWNRGNAEALLVLSWRQKSSARSQVNMVIEDVLDTGLPRAYSPELYQQKCSAVFEHVYESYPEKERSVYQYAS